MTQQQKPVKRKKKKTALILCTLFGFFGAHRFYTGKIFTGIVYLMTLGLLGYGVYKDANDLAYDKFKDSHGNALEPNIVEWAGFAWGVAGMILGALVMLPSFAVGIVLFDCLTLERTLGKSHRK